MKERSAAVIELRIGIGRCRVDESTSPDRCGNVDTEWHDGMHTGKGKTNSCLSRGARTSALHPSFLRRQQYRQNGTIDELLHDPPFRVVVIYFGLKWSRISA